MLPDFETCEWESNRGNRLSAHVCLLLGRLRRHPQSPVAYDVVGVVGDRDADAICENHTYPHLFFASPVTVAANVCKFQKQHPLYYSRLSHVFAAKFCKPTSSLLLLVQVHSPCCCQCLIHYLYSCSSELFALFLLV